MKKIKLWVALFALLLVCIGVVVASWSGIRLYRETQTEAYINALIRPKAPFPLILKWKTSLGTYAYDPPAYQSGLVLIPTDKGEIGSS